MGTQDPAKHLKLSHLHVSRPFESLLLFNIPSFAGFSLESTLAVWGARAQGVCFMKAQSASVVVWVENHTLGPAPEVAAGLWGCLKDSN